MHTYTSIYLHIVFATWSRQPFLAPSIRARVHAYIATVARNLGVADVESGGHEDHIHLLGRFDPTACPAEIIGKVKHDATVWIHEELKQPLFRWQRGYGMFSVSRDRVRAVVRYIRNQEEHHRKRSFAEEFERLLHECGVSLESVKLL